MKSRRAFLGSAVSLSALTLLGGCARALVKPPQCAHFDAPDGKAIIDAHCHIFNATDLQVAGFINQVKLKLPDTNPLNVIGDLIQAFGWAYAPDAKEELTWLTQRKTAEVRPMRLAGFMGPEALSATVHDMGANTDERYAAFWREVASREPARANAFAERLAVQRMAFAPAALRASTTQSRMILSQLQSVQGVEAYIQDEQTYGYGGIAIVSFLKTFFRFRTENAWTMLQTYGCDSTPSVDLLCPALVDFDLWLGDADHNAGRTRSALVDQLAVMAEISLATQGRIKAMAPFNPLRAACAGGQDYVALSRKAIDTYGCVAFKLYPPMGFAATGNAGMSAESIPVPRCGHGAAKVGRRELDRVLGDFFDYCSAHDVPVMAHASPSNAAYDHAEKLASPSFWRQLMGGHAELLLRGDSKVRVSLGHMGGDRELGTTNQWREEIISLMKAYPDNVYADLGYYEHVLGDDATRKKLAVQLAGLKDANVSSRVMYGSDWSMLAAQPRAYNYLTAMGGFLENDLHLDPREQAAIFGENAKRFFGLGLGTPAWERMERFHQEGGRSMDALRTELAI